MKKLLLKLSKFGFFTYVILLLSVSSFGALVIIYDNKSRILNFFERNLDYQAINKNLITTPIINDSDYEINFKDNEKFFKNFKGNEHLTGYWTEAFDWPMIAVHSILLPTQKILTFGSINGEDLNHKNNSLFTNKEIKLSDGRTIQRDLGEKQWEHHNVFWGSDFDVWDPSKGIGKESHYTMIDPVKVNSFCSIIRVMDNENVFLLGGDEKPLRKNRLKSGPDTQKSTLLFNINNYSFSKLEDMNYPRWYGSDVRLKNDDLLILGGRDNAQMSDSNSDYDRNAIVPEILRKKNGSYSWEVLHNLESEKFFGAGCVEGQCQARWNYPKAYLTKNNSVFGISYNELFLISNLEDKSEIKKVGEIPLVNNPIIIKEENYLPNMVKKNGDNDQEHSHENTANSIILGSIGSPLGWNSSSVMLRSGEIITLGGIEVGHLPSNHVYSINIINPEKPIVEKLPNMNYPRVNQNVTIFPNGNLFVNGGNMFKEEAMGDHYGDNFSVLIPEVYDYKKRQWKELKKTNHRRNYHSTSLLLHDGRILVAGGDVWNAQFYYPPYLLEKKRDGGIKFADRPFLAIEKNEITLEKNNKIIGKIDPNNTISKISMISGGSITHSQPSELKYFELPFEKVNEEQIEITIPNDENINNGFYMIFGLDNNSTPTIGNSIIIK